ncbi:MAG: energy-coupling factor transporter transmembrane protein EcfT [Oscillospiraceae bacterium]|nr:energy-coupling factor transporter transmembrane protein EcfT [Oscillospiraceae bacterium]
MKQDAFAGFHPAVNLCFFACTIGLSMFLMHPVFLSVSLICGSMYLCCLQDVKGFVRQVGYLLPVLLFTAMLNPLFNREGATVLFCFPNGDPVTLESLCYGLASAALMGATVIWFNCCSAVFTTDKIIYLFGRIIPSLSLLISMTLRFVPRFKEFLQETMEVQRAMEPPKNKTATLKQALTAFSATVSWAMEQSIVTADSMKSRGYGTAGRTAYAIYRFEHRDGIALAVLTALFAGTVLPWLLGLVEWTFLPEIKANLLDFGPLLSYFSFTGICLMPMLIDLTEDLKWNSLRSKI